MRWEQFNANQYVKVRLTDRGRELVYAAHLANVSAVRGAGGKGWEYKPVAVDADGYAKFQLWHFMALFGPHMELGMDVLFDLDLYIQCTA